ncbi:MAG: bifunctional nicotinamidase/pyrazinamidase [Candidatus Sericytochromatia bacterium]
MKALILVDIQNDFCPGGALAVHEGDRIVHVVNRLLPHFDLVVATQDWHPEAHGSFASNHEGKNPGDMHELAGLPQVMWPNHCVQKTEGAEFHPELDLKPVEAVFRKGTDPAIDSYSGFYDNGRKKSTGLVGYFKDKGVTEVHVVGLATDYCVKFTALDAHQAGFATTVIEDATRGVNLAAGDVDRAIAEMKAAGINVVTSDAILGTPTR